MNLKLQNFHSTNKPIFAKIFYEDNGIGRR